MIERSPGRRRPSWAAFPLALLPALCLPLLTIAVGCTPTRAGGRGATTMAADRASSLPVDPVVARIRDEGLNRSQAMDTLDYLCNVIGPRLTGSPNLRRANEWTRDRLGSWGLSNPHLEAWGPFGRGWSLRRYSLQVIEPGTIILTGYPRAWSPGYDKPFEAGVVYVDAKTEADFAKYKGKLKGMVVLSGSTHPVEAGFTAQAARMDDERLARMAALPAGAAVSLMATTRPELATTQPVAAAAIAAATPTPATVPTVGELLVDRPAGTPATGPTSGPAALASQLAAQRVAGKLIAFAADEGAALVIGPSLKGDGGTFFVASVLMPNEPPVVPGTTRPATTRPRAWSPDAPANVPQVTLAIEDYNRLVRMIQRGETLKMLVDLQVQFHADDLMAYNTVAEIPGTDRAGEVVMVGAHLDSWHAGTGATDNGVGSAVAMEAVRILRALDLKPRRTIRVALWTGEEEGLLGSTAYVKDHFGYVVEPPAKAETATKPTTTATTNAATEPSAAAIVAAMTATTTTGPAATRPAASGEVVKGPEYEKLSAYFNLDNGTGRVRGIYAQGNVTAIAYFKQWLRPFADLGAKTVTAGTTGSTDHIAFDRIGLPGFGFIQDPIEYMTRTHHSNADVYDRIQAEDVKQAATIMAAFAWEAANLDERFPRKPAPTTRPATNPSRRAGARSSSRLRGPAGAPREVPPK